MQLKDLLEMMTYKRPTRSPTEEAFIARYLDTREGVLVDDFGNRYVDRLRPDGSDSTTLFSCHTDTVHPQWKEKGGMQNVVKVPKAEGWVEAAGKSQLGADDAVGIWLMLHLLDHGVPGLYVFHRAEEVGGLGSQHAAKVLKASGRLDTIQRAIAFDRKGTQDIITHQAGGRCASDEFGQALALALGMSHEICDSGVFTDTANYMDDVPECTNIAAGYEREHTFDEKLYLPYVEAMAQAVLGVEWDGLPTARDPKIIEPQYANWGYHGFTYRERNARRDQRDLEHLLLEHDIKDLATALLDLGISARELELTLEEHYAYSLDWL